MSYADDAMLETGQDQAWKSETQIYKYLIFIIVLSHDASFSTAILEILKLNCVCTVPG